MWIPGATGSLGFESSENRKRVGFDGHATAIGATSDGPTNVRPDARPLTAPEGLHVRHEVDAGPRADSGHLLNVRLDDVEIAEQCRYAPPYL
jgi:hypothetical protein